jgi:hypothetical protein
MYKDVDPIFDRVVFFVYGDGHNACLMHASVALERGQRSCLVTIFVVKSNSSF